MGRLQNRTRQSMRSWLELRKRTAQRSSARAGEASRSEVRRSGPRRDGMLVLYPVKSQTMPPSLGVRACHR